MDHIVTVIKGKVEDIKLPDGIEKVDIIISEWMGYALLYESMLDSVLRARDIFLKPEGVMAPSQCQMMLGVANASEIIKERISFWEDVYGNAAPDSLRRFRILNIIDQGSTCPPWRRICTVTP